MLIADALTSVKARLDVPASVTDFDANLEIFITDSVKRLYPYASVEVDEQIVDISPVNGEVSVLLNGLTTPIIGFRDPEYSSDASNWHPVDEKQAHGNKLTIRGLPSSASKLKIPGLNPYKLDDLPEYLELGIIYYACSEFFNYLMGNKRKYNIYMQASGARSVDNMQDMAEYYEQKADVYIADRATVYGY